jgi:hypothetical protein
MKSIADTVGVDNLDDDIGVRNLLNLLFDVFDLDGSNCIDLSDLASALILVCGGSREDNITGMPMCRCITPVALLYIHVVQYTQDILFENRIHSIS